MQTVSYGAFSESIHRHVRAAQVPLNVTIEVTRRCPLVCAHCYNNLPMGDRRAQLEELSCAEHCRILDELADADRVRLEQWAEATKRRQQNEE